MGELVGQGQSEQPTPANSGIPLVQGGNPAWNDVLQYIPEEKRPEAVTKLQEWDRYNQTLQEEYKPWKSLQEQGIDRDQVEYALRVVNLIENDPRSVFERVAAYLKQNGSLPEGYVVPDPNEQSLPEIPEGLPDITQHPEFQKVKALAEKSTEAILEQYREQQKQKMIEEQLAAFDRDLEALKKKEGDIPEGVVRLMTHMMANDNNLSMEDAYKEVTGILNQLRPPNSPPFTPLGYGRAVPPKTIDTKSLDDKGVKDLVNQMLSQANAERG